MATRLEKLKQMFLEPDGAFVWRGQADGESWQLDGVIHDGQGHVESLELRCRLPSRILREFFAALEVADERLQIFDLEHGTIYRMVEFLALLDGP